MNTETELGKTRFEKVVTFLRETRKAVYLIIIVAGLVTIGFFDIEIPFVTRFLSSYSEILVGGILGSILFYIPSKWFISNYYTVDSSYFIEIDAKPDDGAYVEVYEVGRGKVNDLDFEGATPVNWPAMDGKQVYMVRDLDLEAGKAVTTHHAEMSDIEMMEHRNKVEEGRLRSKKWALIGMKLYARFDTIVENIEARFWSKKTDEFLDATFNAKEDVKSEVESEIPELEDVKGAEDDENLTASDLLDNAPDGIESMTVNVGDGDVEGGKTDGDALNE
jgi:hypothetical protein